MTNDPAVNKAPIIEERRDADTVGLNYAQRIITVIAVPYEQPAPVLYRQELWNEVFERSAFDQLKTAHPNRVRANRDHDKGRTIGKVMKFFPSREEGLVAEVRISNTPLGDETLELAADDALSASIGFGVRQGGQVLDKRSMTRRITSAFLDHLSFVASPAFEGADVLSVCSTEDNQAGVLPKLMTPHLDQFTDDEILRWAAERLNKK